MGQAKISIKAVSDFLPAFIASKNGMAFCNTAGNSFSDQSCPNEQQVSLRPCFRKINSDTVRRLVRRSAAGVRRAAVTISPGEHTPHRWSDGRKLGIDCCSGVAERSIPQSLIRYASSQRDRGCRRHPDARNNSSRADRLQISGKCKLRWKRYKFDKDRF